jgi:hypothetical protein
MRAKGRRGKVEPLQLAVGVTACACGKGEDRCFSGSLDSLTCDRCHQSVTFEEVAVSQRQMRELERRFSKPHVCGKAK